MFLWKAFATNDHDKPRGLRRRPVLLAALLVAGIESFACTGGQDASRTAAGSAQGAGASAAARTIAASDTQHVVLAVKGMYCSGCELTVATMLRRTAGVMRAEVSVERGEAAVSYDSTRTSPAQLVQVVKTLGYGASVKRT